MYENCLIFFNKKEKIQSLILLFLFIVVSILEMIGVGTIPILLSVFINPEILKDFLPFESLVNYYLSFNLKFQLYIILSLILFIFILKNFIIFIAIFFKVNFFLKLKLKITKQAAKKIMSNSYRFHMSKNNAVLLKYFGTDITRTITYLDQSFVIIQELLILISIAFLLFYSLPSNYIFILIIGFILIALFYYLIKNKINKLSSLNHISITNLMKNINQIYGSIKEIKIYNKKDYFENRIADLQINTQKIEFFTQIINKLPKIFLELLSVITLVIILLLFFFENNNLVNVIPTLGLVAFALIKIIPSLSALVAGYTQIKIHDISVAQIKDLLLSLEYKQVHQDKSFVPNFLFKDKIEIQNLNFNYETSKNITLKNISFQINKGDHVTIVGQTGSGKSTLIDFILGIHDKYTGNILIDGVNISKVMEEWHKILAYVPQQVYIFDENISNNIAFGHSSSEIDYDKMNKCIKIAELEGYIKNLPDGLNTIVGDRGKQMSGGQLKRLGIARALYRDPEILILDEATSEVDDLTQNKILDNLQNLKKGLTIISVTHNIKNTERANKTIKLHEGSLVL